MGVVAMGVGGCGWGGARMKCTYVHVHVCGLCVACVQMSY